MCNFSIDPDAEREIVGLLLRDFQRRDLLISRRKDSSHLISSHLVSKACVANKYCIVIVVPYRQSVPEGLLNNMMLNVRSKQRLNKFRKMLQKRRTHMMPSSPSHYRLLDYGHQEEVSGKANKWL